MFLTLRELKEFVAKYKLDDDTPILYKDIGEYGFYHLNACDIDWKFVFINRETHELGKEEDSLTYKKKAMIIS